MSKKKPQHEQYVMIQMVDGKLYATVYVHTDYAFYQNTYELAEAQPHKIEINKHGIIVITPNAGGENSDSDSDSGTNGMNYADENGIPNY